MQQLLNFVIRNKTFLLFLLLLIISLAFTIQSHSYHRSEFINSANALTGGVYSTVNSVDQYFSLKEQNNLLHEENKYLRQLLINNRMSIDSISLDTSNARRPYKIRVAEVYKNSYSKPITFSLSIKVEMTVSNQILVLLHQKA